MRVIKRRPACVGISPSPPRSGVRAPVGCQTAHRGSVKSVRPGLPPALGSGIPSPRTGTLVCLLLPALASIIRDRRSACLGPSAHPRWIGPGRHQIPNTAGGQHAPARRWREGVICERSRHQGARRRERDRAGTGSGTAAPPVIPDAVPPLGGGPDRAARKEGGNQTDQARRQKWPGNAERSDRDNPRRDPEDDEKDA